jgi:hypothetical protein
MDLENRIQVLVELGTFMRSQDESWSAAKTRAFQHNAWFIPEFIQRAVEEIADRYLNQALLEKWVNAYDFPSLNPHPKKVGIVMAGNIPLVGFHDFLCCFLSGHQPYIKLSSKDPWLLPALLNFLDKKIPAAAAFVPETPGLRGMDAYIATGSNNSARYFDYYFGKYPSLIRRNRTSIAVLEGNETREELDRLADDVFLYSGLGCRNVTQILVPEKYDFQPLLEAFGKYRWMADHNKYKNNYDYRLSLAILNRMYYMTNESVLMLENQSPFSPISVLHYAYRKDQDPGIPRSNPEDLQCVVGRNFLPFGKSQQPELGDYADGADTMLFLRQL